MRTRYLSTDYFFGGCSGEALRGFTFLSLPAPCIPPPLPLPVPCAESSFSRDFDLQLDVPDASAIDALPVDGALFQFLSDVVPKFCSDGEGKSPEISLPGEKTRMSRSEADGIVGLEGVDDSLYRGEEVRGHDNSVLETPRLEITEVNESFSGQEKKEPYEVLQFEVVKVDFLQARCMSHSGTEEDGITVRIPGIEIAVDMVSIELENTIPYLHEVGKSISLVENIPTKSIVDEGGYFSVEDSNLSDGDLAHFSSLPKFEVCEPSLEFDECLCLCSEVFNLLIPHVKNWHDGLGDDICANAEAFLESMNYDILKHSVKSPSVEIPEFKPIPLDSFINTDMLRLNSNIFLVKDSAIYPMESSGHSLQTPCLVYLQEVQILDLPLIHRFRQMFDIAEMAKEQEILEQNFKDDIRPIECLYESIISSELCLVNDTFKSLPTPILCEDKTLRKLSLIIDDFLVTMRPHPESACDGIYLDWHPLTEETCNHEICYTHINMLLTIRMYDIAPEMQFLGEESVVFYLSFLDAPQEVLDISQCEQPPRKLTSSILDASEQHSKNASPCILQNESQKIERQVQNESTERVSFLFGTMSQSNDLNFFVNARRGITSTNGQNTTKEKYVWEIAPPAISSNATALSASLGVDFHHWNVEENQVTLSDDILGLVDNIQKIYLAILTNETDLRQKQHLFPVVNDLELLRFPKQKLMGLIRSASTENEIFWPLVTLYVIKQLAYFLCYFGIHTSHIYMWKISQASEYLKARLSSTQCLIEDALKKAEKELIESHPALSIVEDILRRKPCQKGEKTLVVSERLFWLPLNRKLTSMNINFREVGYSDGLMEHSDALDDDVRNSILEDLSHSDIFLISHENISGTFPFNKFCNILEYGGPCSSSRICNVPAKLVPLPQVHFLKVNLEDHRVLEALCEGTSSQQPEYTMAVGNKEVVELINFLPTKETSYIASSESANKADSMRDIELASSGPYSSPDTVIIVNTQNSEKEMLVSRRSSYQKILATEKVGVQVVEREIDLPFDIVFTAAVCLVWYDARNVKITSVATEETSCIARFMETFATNVLMSLSFAFNGCILIFEGESTFLAAMMEFSDALYAAAASLDMYLQLFCSYSPESTDEIVLSCINNNIKLHKHLYPAMMESETLAESFLVKFPSINTLSAHAILSSGGMLGEFLQWSFEQRIQAVGKYHIPDESMTLLDALCRYGELGESKSGMTECSSIDSDVSSGNAQFQCKRQKCKGTSDMFNLTMDDFLYVGPENKPSSDILEPSKETQPCQTRNIFSIEGMMKKTSNHMHSNSNKVFDDKWGLNHSETSNIDWIENGGHNHVHEDLNGEVINRNFKFLDEGFQSIPNYASFTRMPELRTEPVARNSQIGGRYGYGSTIAAFPSSAEINYDGDIWTNSKQHNQILEESVSVQKDIGSKGDVLPLKRYGGFVREHYTHENINMLESPIRQKPAPVYGGNLFSNANQSSRLQQGSRWTIDFINKIKEQSKMHQKSFPCNTCLSCPGSPRNRDKYSPNRSPSTIDSYRYQGASKLKKTTRQRWQKQVGKPLGLSNNVKKASSVVVPTWTPVDKKARLNLSFTRDGREKQSKLVWINRNLPGADCNLRKRVRDES